MSQTSPVEVQIEILPGYDIIYKIPDDLDFENWNFGFSVNGVTDPRQIDRVLISHYSKNSRVHFIGYSGAAIAHFLKGEENGALLFHNFHFRLPQNLSVDSLELEIFLTPNHTAKKSVVLVRYEQRNQYRLPVSDTWFVSSGHDFGVEHRRHLSRGHFAWDFIRTDADGQVTGGPYLTDYYSYGQPVFAVAAGVVIAMHDDEQDNQPGSSIRSTSANYVEIDHGRGEISRAVHLKMNSATVAAGDSVKAGQIIAAVGNSGNSDGPHLHFSFHHNLPDGDGGIRHIPIPVQFNNYRVSWNQGMNLLVKTGRPRRGQFIRQE